MSCQGDVEVPTDVLPAVESSARATVDSLSLRPSGRAGSPACVVVVRASFARYAYIGRQHTALFTTDTVAPPNAAR
jgi:hypothetical protein